LLVILVNTCISKNDHFKFIYFRLADPETKSFVLGQLIQSKQLCTCKLGMADN